MHSPPLRLPAPFGTAVYEARSHAIVERATSRHTVTAIAVEDSVTTVRPYTVDTITVHTGSFEWDDMVKAGDRLTIWVDSDGNYVGPPTPTSRAGADAVVAGLATWLGAIAATSALIASLRSLLNRLRYAGWERDLRCLADDDRGHTT